MRFYILEKDYLDAFSKNKKCFLKVNQATAVLAYKRWFFSCLKQLGRIVLLKGRLEEKKIKAILGRADAILVSVHLLLERNLTYRVPHRFLWLTLGSLLLPEHILYLRRLPSAQVNLVSTQFQLGRLRSCLGGLAPEMAVFSNRVDTDYYTIPNQGQRLMARKKQGIREGQLHIVYAGRWIVTKGICQLIRALDIWPVSNNIVLTLAGNIEEEFGLVFSFAQHKTFSHFFNEEILRNKPRPWLRFQQAKDKQGLRELFWSADLFVNLSIQPDENFGVTPRQAMACGLPLVTTNFCGLRSLADNMPWKGIDTYPTLFGSRFSLKQFRGILQRAIRERNLLSNQEYRDFIIKECHPEMAKENLKNAVEYLVNTPAEVALNIDSAERNIKRRMLNSVDARTFKYFTDTRIGLGGGAYVYGDGPSNYAFPIVQAIYSTRGAPPKVEKNSRWRGFFRIAFWDEEKALMEFGYPGPRIRRYPKKLWSTLKRCAHCLRQDEYVLVPKEQEQIAIIQELVDLGYLVSDDY